MREGGEGRTRSEIIFEERVAEVIAHPHSSIREGTGPVWLLFPFKSISSLANPLGLMYSLNTPRNAPFDVLTVLSLEEDPQPPPSLPVHVASASKTSLTHSFVMYSIRLKPYLNQQGVF